MSLYSFDSDSVWRKAYIVLVMIAAILRVTMVLKVGQYQPMVKADANL